MSEADRYISIVVDYKVRIILSEWGLPPLNAVINNLTTTIWIQPTKRLRWQNNDVVYEPLETKVRVKTDATQKSGNRGFGGTPSPSRSNAPTIPNI